MLFDRIDAAYQGLSKGKRRIAGFIRESYDEAAFMTAAKLGETVGVSESTVVRFAFELGYEGYPELQRELHEMIRSRLTAVQRIRVANRRRDGDVLARVLETDMDTIRRTLEYADREAFAAAVRDIIAARRVFIMGVRSSTALASFMSFYFTHIFEDVRNIDASDAGMIFERILNIGPDDIFIGITFSRYSRRTLKAAAFAKENGARIVAITDSSSAPIAALADHLLTAKSDMASFADSLVAPLSLINALIVAIGYEKSSEISETYARLENIWDEYNVYEKTEGKPSNGAAD